MRTSKAAVIGCGNRSKAHIRAYEQLENAEVVACCAPTPTRRDQVAAEFGLRAYPDPQTMIQQETPDIVHIVTPPQARVDLMTQVSELGVPLCTVEKPIALGVEDWRALCALEAKSSTRFGVCHQLRYASLLLRGCDLLASGKLGEIRFLDMAAGSNIADQGTHILNYGMALNGDSPVVRVLGTASGHADLESGHPSPDTAVGYLTFANGARAMWNTGYTGLATTPPLCDEPGWAQMRMAAYAERGQVSIQLFGPSVFVTPHGVERIEFPGREVLREQNLAAQAAFHQAMFDWLDDESRVPGTALSQSLHEWKAVLALYASTVQRAPIDLADYEPSDDLIPRLREAVRRPEAADQAPGGK